MSDVPDNSEHSTTLASLKLTVGIATAGRRDTLRETLHLLSLQSRLPDRVLVCPSVADDCDETQLAALPFSARVVRGRRGLTAQRNTILRHCDDNHVIVFFDDDFYPSRDYLERLEQLLLAHPDVMGVTGDVLADGKLTLGVDHASALQILASHRSQWTSASTLVEVYNLYGCNMAIRMDPIRRHELRFDENLPLYSWLEDVDFTRQIARYGRLVLSNGLTGVHLATKLGPRSAGVRFGYAQIANPLYLMRKGTMAPDRALAQLARNIAANTYHFLRPEPWVDRRGRLRGNALAAIDLVRGQLHPLRSAELQ